MGVYSAPSLSVDTRRSGPVKKRNRKFQQGTPMNVRCLTTTLALLAALALVGPAAAQFDEPPTLDKSQAGYYRLKIGKVDVIAVNDGAAAFDVLGVVAENK